LPDDRAAAARRCGGCWDGDCFGRHWENQHWDASLAIVMKLPKRTARIAAEFAVFEPHYRVLALSVALVLAAAYVYSAWNYAARTAWNEARMRFDFRASQIETACALRW